MDLNSRTFGESRCVHWYVQEEDASEWVSHSLGLHNLIHFECHLTELDSPCAPTGTKISSDNNFQIIQFLAYMGLAAKVLNQMILFIQKPYIEND